MKVNAPAEIASSISPPNSVLKGDSSTGDIGGVFRQLMKDEQYPAIRDATEKILHGKSMEPKELLVLQVRVAEYSQRVELCSRCAESVLTTARKLQSAQ